MVSACLQVQPRVRSCCFPRLTTPKRVWGTYDKSEQRLIVCLQTVCATPCPNPCFLPSSLTLPPISHTPHSELEGDDEWGRRLGFCRSLRGPKPEEGEELDENRGE